MSCFLLSNECIWLKVWSVIFVLINRFSPLDVAFLDTCLFSLRELHNNNHNNIYNISLIFTICITWKTVINLWLIWPNIILFSIAARPRESSVNIVNLLAIIILGTVADPF